MSQFYEKHIFVCENIREGENARVSCGKSNAKKIREYLKIKIKEVAPNSKIRVNMSGCLDRCELGPIQVCYPAGDWFALKTEKDVDDFIKNYIQNENRDGISHLTVI
ncbi:MAG TPA: (2Fe-2S) ferredoxin domain-containing protein [Leptospiraceae bacterium]|nr:(2Fe-2S) ferredoxin domain-containing protein [Leptospiraceae bacterium]HMW06145.1 (2Fe-2S) ferredoxin domain-containing protein [Leptospiraceae bacterium]HMX30727.1 (2Fe-2S) ferredoxin domain-containing protein [Leptospiraceae bacterium]HMY31806.1 (2Fe-2S) ferredoxin domain-containing protein [Leptospiraceae bacterium]HMZ63137.1 (2Fe-2S) ferredoxin domain-containing protein [Leptospiraceae bacterium]